MATPQPRGRRDGNGGAAVLTARIDPPRYDMVTACALAAIAAALATELHEFAGHGGFCVLSGGHMELVTTVNFDCSTESRWMMAGGTLVNFAAGAVALWMARISRGALAKFFFWALMTINLLDGAGYFLYSGVAGIGDWANFIAGLSRPWLWRLLFTFGGLFLYWRVLVVVNHELRPFLPGENPGRYQAARRLMLTVYFTFGLLSVAAGTLNPVGPQLIAISAAAASFGGASGLAWCWQFYRGHDVLGAAPLSLPRSWWAIGAAIAVAATFIVILGPGIRLR